jgi:hypothetical protein
MSGQISIAMSTSSQVMNWYPTPPWLPAAQPPTIKVNGLAIQPSNPPSSPTGFQIVIFDITQTIPTPASILVNQWLQVYPAEETNNSWWNTYESIYFGIVNNLLLYGNPENQLVVLASYGLDANMAPDNDALEFLMNDGAGQQVQTWVKTCDPGSQVGNSTSWVSFPANYLFVGFGNIGYGRGSEIYQIPQGSNTNVASTLNVTMQPDSRILKAA